MSSKTNWLTIKKEYLKRTVDGENVVLSQLAKKHGVKVDTLRSRKSREKWDDFLESIATLPGDHCNTIATRSNDTRATKGKRSNKTGGENQHKTDQEKANIKRSIGMMGNKNAVGNTNAPPKGNQRARKHGFYSKHFPEGTMELFDDIEVLDPLELLWDSIKLKYTAIVRAQSIMYVEDHEDTTEHLKKHKIIKGLSHTEEKEWEIQFAWDKYATFLNAQSRAMSELRGLIKQYNEQLDRGAATYEQELRVKKLQVEIDHMTDDGDADEKSEAINNFIKATTMSEAEVAKLFEGEKDD